MHEMLDIDHGVQILSEYFIALAESTNRMVYNRVDGARRPHISGWYAHVVEDLRLRGFESAGIRKKFNARCVVVG
jgi:hypothetical protein